MVAPLGQREDEGSIGGDGDGVFEVGRALTIAGDDGPSIVEDFNFIGTDVDHWFDGEDHPGAKAQAFAKGAIIGDLRFFV